MDPGLHGLAISYVNQAPGDAGSRAKGCRFDRRDCVRERRGVNVGNVKVCTAGTEEMGCCETDSGRAAGENDELVLEVC